LRVKRTDYPTAVGLVYYQLSSLRISRGSTSRPQLPAGSGFTEPAKAIVGRDSLTLRAAQNAFFMAEPLLRGCKKWFASTLGLVALLRFEGEVDRGIWAA
jgi:hypothetical protein